MHVKTGPAPDIVVPGARHQEILLDGGRREGEAGNGVVTGVGDLIVLVWVAQTAPSCRRAKASGGCCVRPEH